MVNFYCTLPVSEKILEYAVVTVISKWTKCPLGSSPSVNTRLQPWSATWVLSSLSLSIFSFTPGIRTYFLLMTFIRFIFDLPLSRFPSISPIFQAVSSLFLLSTRPAHRSVFFLIFPRATSVAYPRIRGVCGLRP